MRPTINDTRDALRALFPELRNAHDGTEKGFVVSIDIYDIKDFRQVTLHSEPGYGGVYLRYRDLHKIAEAFGTEHLNFQSIAGEEECDSVTWDGTLLKIEARYPEGK